MDKLKSLVVLVVVLALSGCMEDVIRVPDFENKSYINASNISMIGAGGTSGSLENISDLNMGYFNVTEGNAQPFYVIVNFTNITNFSFLEAKARYFSISGTPSSHVVDLEIYCTTDNEYEDLFFLENAAEWRYFTRHFPDSMHFIDENGNVSVKFNHSANGNVNHVLWIDTVRLITSAQYEQNIITVNQYFNTTVGGGGGISFNGSPVDVMNSRLYNISNQSNITGNDFHFLDGGTFNGTVDGGRGRIQNVSFLSLTNAGTAGFDIQNTGSSVVNSLAVGAIGNMNLYGNWNSTVNNVSNSTYPVWAFRFGVAGTQLNKLRFIYIAPGNPNYGNAIAGDTGETAMEIYMNKSVNISVGTDLLMKNLTGIGDAYLCVDANGKVFRSAVVCVP